MCCIDVLILREWSFTRNSQILTVSAACAACMRKSTEVVKQAADYDAVQCVRARACACTLWVLLLFWTVPSQFLRLTSSDILNLPSNLP